MFLNKAKTIRTKKPRLYYARLVRLSTVKILQVSISRTTKPANYSNASQWQQLDLVANISNQNVVVALWTTLRHKSLDERKPSWSSQKANAYHLLPGSTKGYRSRNKFWYVTSCIVECNQSSHTNMRTFTRSIRLFGQSEPLSVSHLPKERIESVFDTNLLTGPKTNKKGCGTVMCDIGYNSTIKLQNELHPNTGVHMTHTQPCVW